MASLSLRMWPTCPAYLSELLSLLSRRLPREGVGKGPVGGCLAAELLLGGRPAWSFHSAGIGAGAGASIGAGAGAGIGLFAALASFTDIDRTILLIFSAWQHVWSMTTHAR